MKLQNLLKKETSNKGIKFKINKVIEVCKIQESLNITCSENSKSNFSERQNKCDDSSQIQSFNNSKLNYTTIDGQNHKFIKTTVTGDKIYTQKGSKVLYVVRQKNPINKTKKVILIQSFWRGYNLRKKLKLKIKRFTFGKALLNYIKKYKKIALKRSTFHLFRSRFALKYNLTFKLNLIVALQKVFRKRQAKLYYRKMRMERILNLLFKRRKLYSLQKLKLMLNNEKILKQKIEYKFEFIIKLNEILRKAYFKIFFLSTKRILELKKNNFYFKFLFSSFVKDKKYYLIRWMREAKKLRVEEYYMHLDDEPSVIDKEENKRKIEILKNHSFIIRKFRNIALKINRINLSKIQSCFYKWTQVAYRFKIQTLKLKKAVQAVDISKCSSISNSDIKNDKFELKTDNNIVGLATFEINNEDLNKIKELTREIALFSKEKKENFEKSNNSNAEAVLFEIIRRYTEWKTLKNKNIDLSLIERNSLHYLNHLPVLNFVLEVDQTWVKQGTKCNLSTNYALNKLITKKIEIEVKNLKYYFIKWKLNGMQIHMNKFFTTMINDFRSLLTIPVCKESYLTFKLSMKEGFKEKEMEIVGKKEDDDKHNFRLLYLQEKNYHANKSEFKQQISDLDDYYDKNFRVIYGRKVSNKQNELMKLLGRKTKHHDYNFEGEELIDEEEEDYDNYILKKFGKKIEKAIPNDEEFLDDENRKFIIQYGEYEEDELMNKYIVNEMQFEKNMQKKIIKDDIQKLLDDANDNDDLKLNLDNFQNNTRIIIKDNPRGESTKTLETKKPTVKSFCIDHLNKKPIRSKLFKNKISKKRNRIPKNDASLEEEEIKENPFPQEAKTIIKHTVNKDEEISDKTIKSLLILNKIQEKDLPIEIIIEPKINLNETIPRINIILELIQKIWKETNLIFEIPYNFVKEFVDQSKINDDMELARYIIDQFTIKNKKNPVLKSQFKKKKKKANNLIKMTKIIPGNLPKSMKEKEFKFGNTINNLLLKNYYFEEINLDESPNPNHFYYDIEENEESEEKDFKTDQIFNYEKENLKDEKKIEMDDEEIILESQNKIKVIKLEIEDINDNKENRKLHDINKNDNIEVQELKKEIISIKELEIVKPPKIDHNIKDDEDKKKDNIEVSEIKKENITLKETEMVNDHKIIGHDDNKKNDENKKKDFLEETDIKKENIRMKDTINEKDHIIIVNNEIIENNDKIKNNNIEEPEIKNNNNVKVLEVSKDLKTTKVENNKKNDNIGGHQLNKENISLKESEIVKDNNKIIDNDIYKKLDEFKKKDSNEEKEINKEIDIVNDLKIIDLDVNRKLCEDKKKYIIEVPEVKKENIRLKETEIVKDPKIIDNDNNKKLNEDKKEENIEVPQDQFNIITLIEKEIKKDPIIIHQKNDENNKMQNILIEIKKEIISQKEFEIIKNPQINDHLDNTKLDEKNKNEKIEIPEVKKENINVNEKEVIEEVKIIDHDDNRKLDEDMKEDYIEVPEIKKEIISQTEIEIIKNLKIIDNDDNRKLEDDYKKVNIEIHEAITENISVKKEEDTENPKIINHDENKKIYENKKKDNIEVPEIKNEKITKELEIIKNHYIIDNKENKKNDENKKMQNIEVHEVKIEKINVNEIDIIKNPKIIDHKENRNMQTIEVPELKNDIKIDPKIIDHNIKNDEVKNDFIEIIKENITVIDHNDKKHGDNNKNDNNEVYEIKKEIFTIKKLETIKNPNIIDKDHDRKLDEDYKKDIIEVTELKKEIISLKEEEVIEDPKMIYNNYIGKNVEITKKENIEQSEVKKEKICENELEVVKDPKIIYNNINKKEVQEIKNINLINKKDLKIIDHDENRMLDNNFKNDNIEVQELKNEIISIKELQIVKPPKIDHNIKDDEDKKKDNIEVSEIKKENITLKETEMVNDPKIIGHDDNNKNDEKNEIEIKNININEKDSKIINHEKISKLNDNNINDNNKEQEINNEKNNLIEEKLKSEFINSNNDKLQIIINKLNIIKNEKKDTIDVDDEIRNHKFISNKLPEDDKQINERYQELLNKKTEILYLRDNDRIPKKFKEEYEDYLTIIVGYKKKFNKSSESKVDFNLIHSHDIYPEITEDKENLLINLPDKKINLSLLKIDRILNYKNYECSRASEISYLSSQLNDITFNPSVNNHVENKVSELSKPLKLVEDIKKQIERKMILSSIIKKENSKRKFKICLKSFKKLQQKTDSINQIVQNYDYINDIFIQNRKLSNLMKRLLIKRLNKVFYREKKHFFNRLLLYDDYKKSLKFANLGDHN